jgi:hypothetical protein
MSDLSVFVCASAKNVVCPIAKNSAIDFPAKPGRDPPARGEPMKIHNNGMLRPAPLTTPDSANCRDAVPGQTNHKQKSCATCRL